MTNDEVRMTNEERIEFVVGASSFSLVEVVC